MTPPEEPQQIDIALTVDWSDAAALPVQPANQFAVQLGPEVAGVPDGIYLTVGFLAPPLILSRDPATRQKEIEALDGRVKVTPYGRYLLTPQRVKELIRLLEGMAAQFDHTRRGDKA